jgi:hypothetical protein
MHIPPVTYETTMLHHNMPRFTTMTGQDLTRMTEQL